jgi:Na+/H+ antiporter NhaC
MLRIIFYRFVSLLIAWLFIIINGIIRDSEETRQKAKKIKEIFGEKRIKLLNIYMFFLFPEVIVILMIVSDIKFIIKGDDFIKRKEK